MNHLRSVIVSGLAALLAQALTPVPARAAESSALLAPGATIKIPDSHGKFDFLEIDPYRHRLLASHEKDGTADFINLDTDTLIKRIKLGPAVCMATDPRTGRYFVSVSDDKRVAVVDPITLTEVNSIPTDGPLDCLIFDPTNRRVYVANDDGTHIWVINADTEKLVATIDIPGAPEYMLYDRATNRIYLNVKTKDEVAVIDPDTNAIIAYWPTAPADLVHGLVYDPATGHLFSVGFNGKVAMIDVRTGQVKSVINIIKGTDQSAFDPATRRIYCAGAGEMSVLQVTAYGATFLGNVRTAPTAKNVAVDPVTHDVWTTYTDGANSYARSWRPVQ